MRTTRAHCARSFSPTHRSGPFAAPRATTPSTGHVRGTSLHSLMQPLARASDSLRDRPRSSRAQWQSAQTWSLICGPGSHAHARRSAAPTAPQPKQVPVVQSHSQYAARWPERLFNNDGGKYIWILRSIVYKIRPTSTMPRRGYMSASSSTYMRRKDDEILHAEVLLGHMLLIGSCD